MPEKSVIIGTKRTNTRASAPMITVKCFDSCGMPSGRASLTLLINVKINCTAACESLNAFAPSPLGLRRSLRLDCDFSCSHCDNWFTLNWYWRQFCLIAIVKHEVCLLEATGKMWRPFILIICSFFAAVSRRMFNLEVNTHKRSAMLCCNSFCLCKKKFYYDCLWSRSISCRERKKCVTRSGLEWAESASTSAEAMSGPGQGPSAPAFVIGQSSFTFSAVISPHFTVARAFFGRNWVVWLPTNVDHKWIFEKKSFPRRFVLSRECISRLSFFSRLT